MQKWVETSASVNVGWLGFLRGMADLWMANGEGEKWVCMKVQSSTAETIKVKWGKLIPVPSQGIWINMILGTRQDHGKTGNSSVS
jgi:hypothetical protein